MESLIKIAYTIFSAVFRDFFGKGGYGLPILKYRMIQHILAFSATFLLCYFTKGLSWYWCLWVALWIQIEWALGHGVAYDCGIGGKPDEKALKRYKTMVGYKLLCKIFPENLWYSFGFDFILLAIRYTYPLIPICFLFNPVFMTLGLIISALYGMYRYCPYFQKHRWLDVEIWAGLALGMFIAYL